MTFRQVILFGISKLMLLLFLQGLAYASSDSLFIELTSDQLKSEEVSLQQYHRYYDGTKQGAADPDLDDSGWEADTSMSFSPMNPPDTWTGERWYRIHLDVEENLHGKSVALKTFIIGAAEVWLNGEHIRTFGNPTNDPDKFSYADLENWITFQLTDDQYQLLALRFVNPRVDQIAPPLGHIFFQPYLTDVELSKDKAVRQESIAGSIRWFLAGFFLVFALTHLINFLFNRQTWYNLWFSICCFLFAFVVIVVLDFFSFLDPETRIFVHRLMQSALLMVFALLPLFLYSAMAIRPSKFYYLIMGFSVIAAIVHPFYFSMIPSLLMLVHTGLIVHLGAKAILSYRREFSILGIGSITFVICTVAVLVLESLGYQVGDQIISFIHLPFGGFAVALVSMSLFQSNYLSTLNRSLRERLDEVKELSRKNLEQERYLRKSEVEKAKLEIENERKSEELEKARNMQLSLLPSGLPDSSHYDIEANMMTATEVGGDYFDYIQLAGDHIIWALGDATGHGTDAGLVVAMTKPLFQTLAPKLPAEEALRHISTELKKAGLKNHFMCLGLLEVRGAEISWCSAGIPPAVIVRAGSKKVELLESKGMPLGTVTGFEYRKYCSRLQPGDTLLLISDGFMEQMNQDRQQIGIEGLKECLQQHEWQSAGDVIQSLNQCLREWKQDMEQQDDVSMVVLKMNGAT